MSHVQWAHFWNELAKVRVAISKLTSLFHFLLLQVCVQLGNPFRRLISLVFINTGPRESKGGEKVEVDD